MQPDDLGAPSSVSRLHNDRMTSSKGFKMGRGFPKGARVRSAHRQATANRYISPDRLEASSDLISSRRDHVSASLKLYAESHTVSELWNIM